MPKPPRCAVCRSDKVAMINAALAHGQSRASIMRTFSVPKAALTKHLMDKHPGVETAKANQGTEPKDALETDPAPTPEGRLRSLILELEGDLQGRNGPVRPELARELRMAYVELQKITGATPNEVRVGDVTGLPELLRDLYLALEPFPEAREAMSGVLKERMGDDEQS